MDVYKKIQKELTTWAQTLAKSDFEKYKSCYSSTFMGGVAELREQRWQELWRAHAKSKLLHKLNPSVHCYDDRLARVSVVFRQQLEDGGILTTYKDLLVEEESGRWKIRVETNTKTETVFEQSKLPATEEEAQDAPPEKQPQPPTQSPRRVVKILRRIAILLIAVGVGLYIARNYDALVDDTSQQLAALSSPGVSHRESVEQMLEAWVESVSDKDFDRYLGFYSENFFQNQSAEREHWKTEMRQIITRPGPVNASIQRIDLTSNQDDTVDVSLHQNYEVPETSYLLQKSLTLEPAEGGWKIRWERTKVVDERANDGQITSTQETPEDPPSNDRTEAVNTAAASTGEVVETAAAESAVQKRAIEEEIETARTALEQTRALKYQLDDELARGAAELEAARRDRRALAKETEALTRERTRVEQEIDQARSSWSSELEQHTQRLATLKQQLQGVDVTTPATESPISADLEEQRLAMIESAREEAQGFMRDAAERINQEFSKARQQLASIETEHARVKEQLDDILAQYAEATRSFEQERAAQVSELNSRRQQLQRQKELIKQNEQRLQSARQGLEKGERSVSKTASLEVTTATVVDVAPTNGTDSRYSQRLMQINPSHLTVQISSERNLDGVEILIANLEQREDITEPFYYYLSRNQTTDWYPVLYGSFRTVQDARQAIQAMPEHMRKRKPRIRRIDDIQERIRGLAP